MKQKPFKVTGGIHTTSLQQPNIGIDLAVDCEGDIDFSINAHGSSCSTYLSPANARRLATELILLSGVASSVSEFEEDMK